MHSMRVNGVEHRTIWVDDDGWTVRIIDQTRLPHEFIVRSLRSLDDACRAIRDMQVRGAPLIGATAAYGLCLALRESGSDESLADARAALLATRPTAVNLRWALGQVGSAVVPLAPDERAERAYEIAGGICDDDVGACREIGRHGEAVLAGLAREKEDGATVNVLTHCNAGWLATVDWGTALAPVYRAHDAGIPVHVWVDETRPRNQGASLTAWELGAHGVPHTVIVDNAGGHLMQHGDVDVVITGTDRTTAAGDVCNKIGTYLKALAARDNDVPFYAAVPSSSVDWTIRDGVREVPIEQRDGDEVARIAGRAGDGTTTSVRLIPPDSPTANPAFDVTPARLVTGLITERGVCDASEAGLAALFPELSMQQEA
jgi:methylthioribose-1-phosphate isomerase